MAAELTPLAGRVVRLSLHTFRITDDGAIHDALGRVTLETEHACRDFIDTLPEYAHACAVGCKGVAVFDCDREENDRAEVQRCDDCQRFESDTEAVAFLQGVHRMRREGERDL